METKKFNELGLIEPIMKSIEEQHFKEPTKIQAKTIPLILKDKDVIGGSKTGSGKTLAFSCGIVQKSELGKGIQALILVPTRELAQQVARSIKTLAKHKKINISTIYGGVSINPQMDELRYSEIVVGTPGRILDHINRNTINLTNVKTLILDEADMMLDMGFLPDVEKIIKYVPKKRQTLLFSATVSSTISRLASKHMNDPVKISSEEYVDPSKLEQVYYNVSSKQKFALLVHFLKQERAGLIMVFCNTRQNTDFVAKNLKINGIQSQAIHGGLTQAKREQILKGFHKGKVYVLICTDVAARGLDIKGVSHVYNYDTCKDPKQYIHRIGRTARAGKDGKAVTILAERDYDNFGKVQGMYDVKIHKKELPQIERVKIEIAPQRGRRDFRRGSNRSQHGSRGQGGRKRHNR